MTSQIRSHVEYVMPTHRIFVLLLSLNITQKSCPIGRFYYDIFELIIPYRRLIFGSPVVRRSSCYCGTPRDCLRAGQSREYDSRVFTLMTNDSRSSDPLTSAATSRSFAVR